MNDSYNTIFNSASTSDTPSIEQMKKHMKDMRRQIDEMNAREDELLKSVTCPECGHQARTKVSGIKRTIVLCAHLVETLRKYCGIDQSKQMPPLFLGESRLYGFEIEVVDIPDRQSTTDTKQ